jgi:hypothetical protein
MRKQLSTQTPVRLEESVYTAFVKHYASEIADNGGNYAVNAALADHLRSLGYSIADLETPQAKIARAQKSRWKETKDTAAGIEAKADAQREKKRERDRRRRERIKAAKDNGTA